MTERIKPIVMPKWGLSMSEGRLAGWLKPAGARIAVGDEILEVETDKIAGAVEAGDAGTLRRTIGVPDTVYPVKALLGVLADDDVPEAEIDAFVAGYVTPAADEEAGEAGPAYLFVDTPAGRLRYARRGEGGETVLLIHGFGGDLDNWLFNVDALAGAATVYTLDLPGHGQSEKRLAAPTLAGLAAAVEGFMDATGVESAHLVGHSMGGAIALKLAAAARPRVRSLALVASAGLGPEINADYIRGFVSAVARRELKPVLEALFADPALVSRQLVEDVLKYKRLDGVEAALSALAAGLFAEGRQQEILAGSLADLPPVLVIHGAEDRIIPAAHAGAFGTGAASHVVAGAGHMVQMEKPARVNELLLAHIGAGAV